MTSSADVIIKSPEIPVEKEAKVKIIIPSILAECHVLIEGVSWIANTIAKLLGIDFMIVLMIPDRHIRRLRM